MSQKIKLNEAIEFSEEQNKNVSLWINEVGIDSDIYNKIIFAYVSIVIEHHKSILDLINIRQTSALALVRPLYEAYIRATWLSLLEGSESVNKAIIQLIKYREDGAFPTLNVMCEEIDCELSKIQKIENQQILSNDLKNNIKLLHSYTHGGAFLVSILINSKDAFTYEDMISIVKSTTFDMLSTALSYAVKIRNLDLATKVDKEMDIYNGFFIKLD
ncbi:MAG: hypothetical protein KJ899_15295 [Gammaproteobacteria bacterium]|nr:hypothetical protein [Gammaproteobacteria bacterium]